jgi:branched-subunit amino acid aminotransferase/4-amino-4-deoxychorismate lyase
MASPTQISERSPAMFWVDGQTQTADSLSRAASAQLGLLLGISPVVYVALAVDQEDALTSLNVDIAAHMQVLDLAALTLGFSGFDAAEAIAKIHGAQRSASVKAARHSGAGAGFLAVALVPDANSHKAAPPGANWFLQLSEFTPPRLLAPESEGGLRVAQSSYRRNQSSPSACLLLEQDAELLAGRALVGEADATLWLNLDGHVACVDQHCVFVSQADGSVMTPPLQDGALNTAWRTERIAVLGAVERSITLADLDNAESVDCITAWGEALRVGSFAGRVFA